MKTAPNPFTQAFTKDKEQVQAPAAPQAANDVADQPSAPAEQVAAETTTAEQGPAPAVPSGQKAEKAAADSNIQMSTFRITKSDHKQVRMLSMRDDIKMNDMIYLALKEYCKQRGVELTGI